MSRSVARRYWDANWRYRRRSLLVLSGVAVGTAIDFVVPLVVAGVLDRLAAGDGRLVDFVPSLLLAAAISIVGLVGWRFALRGVWRLEMDARRDLTEEVFAHLTRQSERFHLDNFGGGLVADTSKFITGYERLTDEFVYTWFTVLVSLLCVVLLLVWSMPIFVLVLLVLSVGYLVLSWMTKRSEMPLSRAVASAHSLQTSQVADTITNIATVRSFGNESLEDSLLEERSDRYVRREDRLMRRSTGNFAMLDGVNRLILLVAISLSIVAVVEWGEPVGTILIVVTYTQLLLQRLRMMQRSFKNAIRALGDARAMADVLETDPTVRDVDDPQALTVSDGSVRFESVGFSYFPEQPLFEDFSLAIEPGQRVGLVGASGSGKTTLSKLLLRFMDVSEGRILVDGVDVGRVEQSSLRRQITYVPQEPLLFHRSVRDNIAYADPDAPAEAIETAARLARAEEFILRLPHGYDTLVGERGAKLSGGQRQRIAIARAFLKRSPLLVLDEATSALDSHSEALIQEALAELMTEQTAIVIAHRLSTVSGLDRIVVLAHGRIIEDGTHEELLAADGHYASLWRRQSGGFLSDEDE